MNNLLILPIFIPLLASMFIILFRKQIRVQQGISLVASIMLLITAVTLVLSVSNDGIHTLALGGWIAPFGISLVADPLAALLVLTTSIVSIACLIYSFSSITDPYKNHYFFSFYLLLICGVNGSFLTGDLFNLFVCFEVMLIASYVLITLGSKKKQLRESIKYVVINVLSSTLFVIAISYLYSITGTLNMAHLSERIALSGQDGLLTTVSLLFLIVFAIKSALFLFIWLPGSYSTPPSVISAIFAALLTKVGIYAIIRMFTLIFYHEPNWTHNIMLWLAGATMLLGAFGAVSHWRINKVLAYNVIISVGFIIFGVAISSQSALSGTIFYLIHDMIAKALIFILGGTIIRIAGTERLRDISGLISFRPLLGWLFFISALALAGVPPLSGFVGKLLILQGGIERDFYILAGIGLFTSLLVLYSVMKIFIHSFWGENLLSEGEEKSSGKGMVIPGLLLTALIFGMGIGADYVLFYVEQAVEVLLNPSLYIEAVLTTL